jgi:hypothetical protein
MTFPCLPWPAFCPARVTRDEYPGEIRDMRHNVGHDTGAGPEDQRQ